MKINIAQNDGLPEDHLICIFIDIIQRNPWKIEDVWSSNWRLKMRDCFNIYSARPLPTSLHQSQVAYICAFINIYTLG